MTRIILPRNAYEAVVAHALRDAPNECCGLLGEAVSEGAATVVSAFPLVNELASPVAYRSEPRSLFDATKAMRVAGIDLVGVYHSHPYGGSEPSRRDVEEWTYADAACVIVGLGNGPPTVRAWRFVESSFVEIPLAVV